MLIEELSKRVRMEIAELKHQMQTLEKTKERPLPALPQKQDPPKLSSAIQKALALLIQRPALAHLIKEPLPQTSLKGFAFLNRLIEMIKEKSEMTTGFLLECFRGQKEEELLATFAKWEHTIPEEGINNEFLGTIRQLTTLSFDEEINRLLAKSAEKGLSDEEKIQLSSSIQKKKALTIS